MLFRSLVGEGGPLAVDEVIPPDFNRFGQNDHRRITPGAKSRQSKQARLQFVLSKTTPLLIDPFLLTIDSLFSQNLLCQKQFPLRLITSSTATAVPLLLQGEGLSALERGQDLQCPATRQRFARRFSEVSRPTSKVKPHCKRHIVLPLEGKGDRSAVDEVTCRPAPIRGASTPRNQKAPGN